MMKSVMGVESAYANAPCYREADVLLVADCIAYTLASFHQDYLAGKSIAIACPKLDENQDAYVGKVQSWLEEARINTLTVMTMQVPCCRGLLQLARKATVHAKRTVPIKSILVGLQGEILSQDWLQ
jgi:hypothetical protein